VLTWNPAWWKAQETRRWHTAGTKAGIVGISPNALKHVSFDLCRDLEICDELSQYIS